ncbi:dnaJ homolog subfamily C member 17-like [Metopolophium dirhodum]|uniref:dnaJ homolog subfamily C member 17-like n=1 Tax=Metopolophium dirhodum TaxID=44670 RepID=UPI00298FAE9C|nr:dnaJ homolog subfamily C member 17-like [Metopolophium dirhodum]
MDSDLKGLDLYGILEIQQSATEKEIKAAYRKKALQCHPDKNPNNPKAAQLFLQLSKVLTILTDTAARLDYDKLVNAKNAAKLLEQESHLDLVKYINDIMKKRNELLVKRDTDERNFKKKLDRLRKESDLRQQETEKEKIGSFILKLKWKKKGVYNKAKLTSLFSKYGDELSVVVLQNKKPMGFVKFKSKTSAINAKNKEVGLDGCPLIVSFLGDCRPDTKKSFNQTSAPNPNTIFPAYRNQMTTHGCNGLYCMQCYTYTLAAAASKHKY